MLPSVFNTTIDGVPAYATGDLLTPHPTKPHFWKIFGRVDDQIMHSTGEKVCDFVSLGYPFLYARLRRILDLWASCTESWLYGH